MQGWALMANGLVATVYSSAKEYRSLGTAALAGCLVTKPVKLGLLVAALIIKSAVTGLQMLFA